MTFDILIEGCQKLCYNSRILDSFTMFSHVYCLCYLLYNLVFTISYGWLLLKTQFANFIKVKTKIFSLGSWLLAATR